MPEISPDATQDSGTVGAPSLIARSSQTGRRAVDDLDGLKGRADRQIRLRAVAEVRCGQGSAEAAVQFGAAEYSCALLG